MQRNHWFKVSCVIALGATAAACVDSPTATRPLPPTLNIEANAASGAFLSAALDQVNATLGARGAGYRAAMAEYITRGDSNEAGSVIVARTLGNKRLSADFVPFDPRRVWSGAPGAGDDITFAIDETGDAVPPFGGVTGAQTTAAIRAAMATWENISCSTLPLTELPSLGVDIGFVAFLNGLGGSAAIVADVQHAGWLDINFAGGILGVTFTFIFVNPDGSPTDIDNNRLADAAFREIYYDPSFNWAVDGVANIDVQTVALHEAGHGLSQNHFGTVFIRNDGGVAASPRAVMNALYLAPLRTLLGTDGAGHCANWANWPLN
jgi:hypothetical protein